MEVYTSFMVRPHRTGLGEIWSMLMVVFTMEQTEKEQWLRQNGKGRIIIHLLVVCIWLMGMTSLWFMMVGWYREQVLLRNLLSQRLFWHQTVQAMIICMKPIMAMAWAIQIRLQHIHTELHF